MAPDEPKRELRVVNRKSKQAGSRSDGWWLVAGGWLDAPSAVQA